MFFKGIIKYLALANQEKNAFLTPIGNYYYRVIPFGLKNAESTY